MSDAAQDSVVITHDVGLHARPSVALTKLAKGFANTIEIAATSDGPWIDAKSIVKVMAMKAKQHSTLHIRASGADADKAVASIRQLVVNDFAGA
jgi:phosphocarrier protein HPr